MKLLNHKKIIKNQNFDSIIFLHGLLGNHKNLKIFENSKIINNNFNRFYVDLRNHGNSFHSNRNLIKDHVDDITSLVQYYSLKNVILVGHSFGGKISIHLSLISKNIKGLVLLDMGPKILDKKNFSYSKIHFYLDSLNKLELSKNRDDVDREIFRIAEGNLDLCSYFKTNLIYADNKLSWRCNLKSILQDYSELYAHRYPNKTYKGPVIEIAGLKSEYVIKNDLLHFKEYFPNINLEEDIHFLDCGHWVHYEKSNNVLQLTDNFLTKFID